MKPFEEQKFSIGELKGISAKNIEEHLKLYSGYVKNLNGIFTKLGELMADAEKNAYLIGELHRRIGFEFNGMRNHEYYFRSLEGGPKSLPVDSEFKKLIETQAPSVEAAMVGFKTLAMTRGIGWAILYYDKKVDQLVPAWIDEQHLGQLQGCSPVLALDMWEHSYVADYQPSGKKQYIEDFFANLNWEVIEENFKSAK
ncbi:superoxide dismutase [Patescibacteria group bacterium]|nr:superoxide dismutase [Patescibacteria group bacterium]